MVAIRRNCLQCARFPRSASRKEAQPSIKSFVPVSYDCSFYSFPFVVSFPFCAERFCEVFFVVFFCNSDVHPSPACQGLLTLLADRNGAFIYFFFYCDCVKIDEAVCNKIRRVWTRGRLPRIDRRLLSRRWRPGRALFMWAPRFVSMLLMLMVAGTGWMAFRRKKKTTTSASRKWCRLTAPH